MLIAGYAFPDDCPPDCPNIENWKHFDQGCICTSCPVFLCAARLLPGEPEGGATFCMVNPEHYGADQAKAWFEWFANPSAVEPKVPHTPGGRLPDEHDDTCECPQCDHQRDGDYRYNDDWD